MKKLLFLFLLSALFAKEIKVVSYNLQNLFDMEYKGSEYEEYIPNKHNWNRNTLNKKLENISKVLCELNADVIGLQEVESKEALNLLLNKLKSKGCNYPYSAITNKKTSAIEVALISKIPIKQRRDIVVSRAKRDRNILEVELKTNPKLTLFVNHWRSKAAPESKRVKYAKALMKRLAKLPKSREYIILGDFNSNYNECENIDKKHNDTDGICGITDILKTYRNGHLITLDKKISWPYHYNLWVDLPKYKRWSYNWYGKKNSPDAIIIPPNLNDNKGWVYKKGSFNVFKKSFLFKNGAIYSWQKKGKKHLGKGYSDHLPIYAVFVNSQVEEESFWDRFWKFFMPTPKEEQNFSKESSNLELTTIKELKEKKYLKEPLLLKNVCVIFKRGDSGVIQASKQGASIFLYHSAAPLKEGYCYDIKVLKKKRYNKMDEITKLEVLQRVPKKIDIDEYIPKFTFELLLDDNNIGAIVKDIKGIYKKGYLYIQNTPIKLYIKEKPRGFLKKGDKLFIKKAQIGYYKGKKELVVYSLDDIIKEQ